MANRPKRLPRAWGSATRRPIRTAAAFWKNWACTKRPAWCDTPFAPAWSSLKVEPDSCRLLSSVESRSDRMTNSFMKQAIELAVANVRREGGPFAALVVKDGIVIATGANQVTRANDPTAHAEIVAIREACRVLGDFQLTGCDIYTSCEPCPMCLGAIFWARPARVFFAATQREAAAAGFDDSFIYRQIEVPHAERTIPFEPMMREAGLEPFREWMQKNDRIQY